MSISLNANFELLSAGLYLDARQQFNTIIEMKDFAETSIPDGFITYNKETQKHYVFSSSNTVDATLGKWREYNSGDSSSTTYATWNSNVDYRVGNVVLKDEVRYSCIADHTSTDFETDSIYWVVVLEQYYHVTQEQYNKMVSDGLITDGTKDLYIIDGNTNGNDDELTKEDVEGLLGLTKEEIEAMTDLILDTEVRIDKTYSSSKIYTDIQQCLEDSKTYTLLELGKFSGVSYKIVASTSEMTSESIIYLLANGSTYDMYIVEENGATTKIGDMDINLSDYYTKTEIAKIETELKGNIEELNNSLVDKADVSELAGLKRRYNSIEELNTIKKKSLVLVNGEDNTQKVLDTLDVGEVLSDYFSNSGSTSRFGINASLGTSFIITFEKNDNGYARIIANSATSNTVLVRYHNANKLSAWKELVTMDKIGSTDISSIGDGTVTGAIDTINTSLESYSIPINTYMGLNHYLAIKTKVHDMSYSFNISDRSGNIYDGAFFSYNGSFSVQIKKINNSSTKNGYILGFRQYKLSHGEIYLVMKVSDYSHINGVINTSSVLKPNIEILVNDDSTLWNKGTDIVVKELATMDKVEELSSNLDELFQSVSDGKTLVANAITDKGVSTSTTATFATMATNIGKINGYGYKEETKSKTFSTTGISVLTITFSANVLAIKQIVAPSNSCSIVLQSSNNIYTINGKELIVHVTGGGTWSFTALIES